MFRAEGLAAARAANMVVHVRSVFLQGVFFMDTARLPHAIQPLLPHLEKNDSILLAKWNEK